VADRPSFQFYPAEWRNNAKLQRCGIDARGAWMDVLCLLHDSDEYGVLRWPLEDIAQAVRLPIKLLRELATKGVLKGSDTFADGYSYAPFHAGKYGQSKTLVEADGGPCWFCSRFVKDEWKRHQRGKGTRFDSDNQPERPARAEAAQGTERARLRAAVLSKTEGKCHHCGLWLAGEWEIDHLIPRSKGGSNLFANLAPSCVRCNQDKGDSMPDDWHPDYPPKVTPTRRIGERQGDGSSSASSSSTSNSKSKAKATSPEPSARFTEFWSLYPKSAAKQDAVKAWNKLGLDAEADRILMALRTQLAGGMWEEIQFVPNGSTFLHGRRWEDPVILRTARAPSPAAPGKTMQALQALQGMKNELADTRTGNGVSETFLLESGPDSRR
jgi:5-methylcytosine-specific restriction endonuclease McrA